VRDALAAALRSPCAASNGCSASIARRLHSIDAWCAAMACAASIPSISSVGLNAIRLVTGDRPERFTVLPNDLAAVEAQVRALARRNA
jgi:hypothetical protein